MLKKFSNSLIFCFFPTTVAFLKRGVSAQLCDPAQPRGGVIAEHWYIPRHALTQQGDIFITRVARTVCRKVIIPKTIWEATYNGVISNVSVLIIMPKMTEAFETIIKVVTE